MQYIYVAPALLTHPKLIRAGELLGPNGRALALALYLEGLCYARFHLTDGFLPSQFVSSCGLVSRPQEVANVLASRGIRLWQKEGKGYRIHHYLDHNRKASAIKEKRANDTERKRAYRKAVPHVSHGDT